MGENENKGLFDLTNLESSKIDDLMELHIFDEDAIKEDTNIPVPGGDKETPTAKPYDTASISIPAKTQLTEEQYNRALSNLKKSFKEGCEVLEMLENTQIIHKTRDEIQNEFTESYIDEAIFESYMDGPYYEAVENNKKDVIKPIAKKIRKELCKVKRQWNPKMAGSVKLAILDPGLIAACNGDLKLYAWQSIGILRKTKGNTLGDILKELNKEFSSDLGEFEIKAINGSILFSAKEADDDDKARKKPKLLHYYFLIIDAKGADTKADIKVEVNEAQSKKLQSVLTESAGCECDDEDDEDKKKKEKKEKEKEEKEEKEKEDKK